PHVREHAVKLCEKFFKDGQAPTKLWILKSLASDPDIHVRYQLAFTMGEIRARVKIDGLAAIAKHDKDDSWLQAAILSSMADGAGELFANLSADADFCASKAGQDFLRQLVTIVGAKDEKGEVAQVVDFIGMVKQP